MAATLATVVVAYKTVNSSGERLLNESYVNASLVLVVVTCVAGPILTGRYARQLKDKSDIEPAPSPIAPEGATS